MFKVKAKISDDKEYMKQLTEVIKANLPEVMFVTEISVNKRSNWENENEEEYRLFIHFAILGSGYYPISKTDLQAALNKECSLEFYHRTKGCNIRGIRAKTIGESYIEFL